MYVYNSWHVLYGIYIKIEIKSVWSIEDVTIVRTCIYKRYKHMIENPIWTVSFVQWDCDGIGCGSLMS